MRSQEWSVHDTIKTLYRLIFGAMALLLFTLSLLSPLWAEEAPKPKSHPEKIITAIRVNPKPPKVDGILDDEVWKQAPIATGFTQRDPDEGKPASEQTAFQIAYDDEALYIGIMCYDQEPDKIVRRLYRRDQIQYGETDWVGLRLDPHHDHQTGFGFAITPSGSFADNTIVNDSGFDGTWDSVWEVKTAINDKGWSVELKIPYHALRFSPKEEYTWGINLDRRIIRKQEYDMWVFVPKNEKGISSRNGHLLGIKGIDPPAHLEFRPFTLGRSSFEAKSPINPEGRAWFSSGGLDFRYGLSSNFSLNATINPDFGQVEADPAVLNLTVFETFFEERRPFFVEGANIFRTPIQLFYSRRIGRRPGHFPLPSDISLIERPETTTILGAAKLSGKTASNTTIGILNALTDSEYAAIEDRSGMDRREHRIEPLVNHFVGRVQQDILENSTVGALVTSVHRREAESAYSGGLDWNLRWRDNAYSFNGQIATTRAGRFNNRRSGYALSLDLQKSSGWFTAGLEFDALSPAFDPNDLGFLSQADRIKSFPWINFRKTQSWSVFRTLYTMVAYQDYRNYDGENMERALNLWVGGEFRNYWRIDTYSYRDLESMNDWKTRGGPLMLNPASSGYQVTVSTPEGKPVRAVLDLDWSPTSDEVEGRSVSGGLTFYPTSALQLRLSPSYRWNRDKAEWVTNVDENEDGTDGHFVFGELTTKQLELTTRANITFTPNLSLQFWMQPFVAVGDYRNFKELVRPRSYEFTPYTQLNFDPDFSSRSLRGNMVLRWEYRPGSALFVVWSQNRSESFDEPAFRPWESVRQSFADEGQNIFLVKLNYWLGI